MIFPSLNRKKPRGTFPRISEARKTHREAKVGLTKGIDPMGAKRRADYLAERREMLQAWADYLDGLKVVA